MKQFIALVSGLGLISVPIAAAAQQPSQSFQVSARVPEYCEVNASPIVAQEGDGVADGTVFESCNTQQGFQVVASHRPLESGETVAFSYAGQTSYLQREGWSQVANRAGARYGVRPIQVRYSGLTTPVAINLTITSF